MFRFDHQRLVKEKKLQNNVMVEKGSQESNALKSVEPRKVSLIKLGDLISFKLSKRRSEKRAENAIFFPQIWLPDTSTSYVVTRGLCFSGLLLQPFLIYFASVFHGPEFGSLDFLQARGYAQTSILVHSGVKILFNFSRWRWEWQMGLDLEKKKSEHKPTFSYYCKYIVGLLHTATWTFFQYMGSKVLFISLGNYMSWNEN